MIRNVTFERTSYQPPPARFEAGTGSIADAAGLATAIGYVERIGRANIARYEHELLGYATRALTAVPGLRLVGTASDKAGILSFVLDGYRPEDVGSALNASGIAVRAGHHCAQPILRRYGLAATVRAALAMYKHARGDRCAGGRPARPYALSVLRADQGVAVQAVQAVQAVRAALHSAPARPRLRAPKLTPVTHLTRKSLPGAYSVNSAESAPHNGERRGRPRSAAHSSPSRPRQGPGVSRFCGRGQPIL